MLNIRIIAARSRKLLVVKVISCFFQFAKLKIKHERC